MRIRSLLARVRSRYDGRVDERGAVALFVALVLCFILVPVSGLVVDIGMQRLARRDAQALADTAAQDAARALGTGTTSAASLLAVAKASITGDTGYVGNQAPAVAVYVGTLSSAFVSDQSLGCGGPGTQYNSYFKATPTGSIPNAVLVTVSNSVRFSFVPGKGAVCRSSIAKAHKSICVTMNSYAAALNSGNSAVLGPLSAILGTGVNATVLGSSGIASADIDVLSFLNVLQTQLGLGSTDQVLAANITATQLLTAEATLLTQTGGTAGVAATALQQQILANIGNIASPQGINVGSILGITQGAGSALGATINALDLASSAVQIANGTHPVTLSASSANLIGLTTTATLGSGPVNICGLNNTGTVAQTHVDVTANLNSPGSLTNSLLTGLTGLVSGLLGLLSGHTITVAVGPITGTVSLAQATGTITTLSCTGATPNSAVVAEAASLAPAKITVPITITDKYKPLIGATTTSTATLTATVSTNPRQPTAQNATFAIPTDVNVQKPGPSGDLSVASLSVSTAVTSDSNNIITAVLGGLSGVLNDIDTLLLQPIESTTLTPLFTTLTTALQNLIGLTVAGSTYTLKGNASCGTPTIAG